MGKSRLDSRKNEDQKKTARQICRKYGEYNTEGKERTEAMLEKIKTSSFSKMRKGLKLPIKGVYEQRANTFVIFGKCFMTS